MNNTLLSILMIILGLICGIVITLIINFIRTKAAESKISILTERARKEAEKVKRDMLFEAKEESHKIKMDLDK